jgi:hypothetical protein
MNQMIWILLQRKKMGSQQQNKKRSCVKYRTPIRTFKRGTDMPERKIAPLVGPLVD